VIPTPHDHTPPLGWLALLGFAVAGLNQLGLWLGRLLAGGPVLVAFAAPSPEAVNEWIQVFNTALITLGSTAILLYQRARARRREDEERRAAEARDEIVRRLDVLATRTDRSADDREDLHERLAELVERVDRVACPFGGKDGKARCHGQDAPAPSESDQ
jgi:hypothetical protein